MEGGIRAHLEQLGQNLHFQEQIALLRQVALQADGLLDSLQVELILHLGDPRLNDLAENV